MMSTDRSTRNLGVLVLLGGMIGCILAYMAHSPSFPFATTTVYLLPFIIAILVGVAKTTTA